MKFKSRKDAFFTSISYGLILLLLALSYANITQNGINDTEKWMYLLILLVIGLLLWIFHGTSYRLDESRFKYVSGPIRGTIEYKDIDELIVGKTLWNAMKPATAKKGIIIKYKKGKEIYISPDSNESFIQHFKTLKKGVKVTMK